MAIEESWRKRRRREKSEKREKRGKILAKNQHLLKRKRGDLAFQRAHTLKSSLRVKLGAHSVSTTSKALSYLSF